jgi:hypothetical protein
MKTTRLLALLLVLLPSVVAAQDAAAPPKSPREYVDEAIAVAKEKSFHTAEVDWKSLSEQAHRAAESAADSLDTYPILVDVLIHLGDGHSFVQASPERQEAFKARHGYPFNRAMGDRKRPTSSFSSREGVKAEKLAIDGAEIQVFDVPRFLGGGPLANYYAQRLYEAQATAAPWACGYVVDLRGNGGGNVWPMLAGLEPLLGEGRVSGSRNRAGVSWTELKDGQALMADHGAAPKVIAQTLEWKKWPGLDASPVAVLIDDATASSGEGVAVAFRDRKNTRFFGVATYGISTSNEGFKLSDGANLVITTGVMVDRAGRDQAHGITPDEEIDPHLAADGGDPALAKAAAWVASRRACPKT